ncbi:MAG: hydroxymethylbilane synthase [Verrucomicrobia bacterium]|nr:hydroxymethylbilane synthase [Verrucomicrobiota bacterium]
MPDAPTPIRIATRRSALALAQARLVLAQCQTAFPHLRFHLRRIQTAGDKLRSASLADPGAARGFFTKAIEVALLHRSADLAVHSLKDLPTELPPALILGAVTARADVRDVLVLACRSALARRRHSLHAPWETLPGGAVVATSSTRRRAQMLALRPDLNVVPLRGNVGTRLRKLAASREFAATLLAAAGLERLGIRIRPGGQLAGPGVPPGLCAVPVDPEAMLPAVGQAALGIEVRADNASARAVCARLDHPATHACVSAERAFLRAMGGGCHLAVAAYATVEHHRLRLRAVSFLGGAPRRAEECAAIEEAETLGRAVAQKLL